MPGQKCFRRRRDDSEEEEEDAQVAEEVRCVGRARPGLLLPGAQRPRGGSCGRPRCCPPPPWLRRVALLPRTASGAHPRDGAGHRRLRRELGAEVFRRGGEAEGDPLQLPDSSPEPGGPFPSGHKEVASSCTGEAQVGRRKGGGGVPGRFCVPCSKQT